MRRLLAALALSVLIPLPAAAGEVTIESGDTLSEIAERNGVSVRELMRLNGIEDADHVEVGTRLRLPGGSGPPPADGAVTVKEGETLSEIAERHGLSVKQLKELNGIKDANLLQAGQTLRLKGTATATSAAASSQQKQSPPSFTYSRGAAEHVVRRGESLTAIAKGHDIPLERLVALNGIEDPNLVKAGQQLRLKGDPAPAQAAAAAPRPPSQTKPSSQAPAVAKATTTTTTTWRSYGPMRVDWSEWQPMGGSMVAPGINEAGQPIYLALNCGARKLNATTADGNWQAWQDPQADFERKLMSDFCTTQ